MRKMFLEDGIDISPKFFWDDSEIPEEDKGVVLDDEDCFEQVVKEIKDAYVQGDTHTFYMKGDAATTRDLQLERENAFFAQPVDDESGAKYFEGTKELKFEKEFVECEDALNRKMLKSKIREAIALLADILAEL